jgi:hypothetical protein
LRLLKLLEESSLLVECDSDSCIANGKLQTGAVVRNRLHRYANFPLLSKFNCIPNQVDQDLTKTDGVTSQVSGYIRRDVDSEFQALLVGGER